MARLFEAIAFLALVASSVHAQTGALQFQHYSTQEGLSQSSVTSIVQLSNGTLVVGTLSGLNIFDGAQFDHLFQDVSDDGTISDNFITALAEDDAKTLWVGSRSGLDYRREAHSDFGHVDLGRRAWVEAIHPEKDGPVWVASRAGLFAVHAVDTGFEAEAVELDEAAFPPLFSVQATKSRLFVGHEEGFMIVEREPWRAVVDERTLGEVRQLWYDENRSILWLGGTEGIFRFDVISGSIEPFRPEMIKCMGRSCSNDSLSPRLFGSNNFSLQSGYEGDLWIGFRDRIAVVDLETQETAVIEQIRRPDSTVEESRYITLYIDRGRQLWIGTALSGLSKTDLSLEPFEMYDTSSGLIANTVRTLHVDKFDRVWVGTEEQGLTVIDRKSGIVSQLTSDVTEGAFAFFEDDEFLWTGTYKGHIEQIGLHDLSVVRHHTRPDIAAIENPKSTKIALLNPPGFIVELPGDPRSRLLVGSRELFLFDRETHEKTPLIEIGDPHASWFFTDYVFLDESRILLASYGLGLMIYDLATGTVDQVANPGLCSTSLYSTWQEPDGVIWVGTDAGLSRIDPSNLTKATCFTASNSGLTDSAVYSVTRHSEAFWFSTNQGLAECSYDRDKEFSCYKYGEAYALQDLEYNHGAFFQTEDELFYGGIGGLNVVNPSGRLRNPTKPIPSILSVRSSQSVYEVASTHQNPLSLEAGEKDLEFALSAGHFSNPRGNQIHYRLLGYSDDWSLSNAPNKVHVGGLAPGDYEMQVKARSGHFVWSDIVNLEFSIDPAWWQTLWFRFLMAVCGIALLVMTIRLQSSKLKRRAALLDNMVVERTKELEREKKITENQADKLREYDRYKSQFFIDVSHELRTPLTLIVGPLRDALDGRQPSLKRLRVMSRNADRMLELTSMILDLAKLEEGQFSPNYYWFDFEQLTTSVIEQLSLRAAEREVNIQFVNRLNETRVYLDEASTRTILLNLLSNAIKYSHQSGSVVVDASRARGNLMLSVEDYGIGIRPEAIGQVFDRFYRGPKTETAGSGIGLALSKGLVDLMGGTIEVTSTHGVGSQFIVTLPCTEDSRSKDSI